MMDDGRWQGIDVTGRIRVGQTKSKCFVFKCTVHSLILNSVWE